MVSAIGDDCNQAPSTGLLPCQASSTLRTPLHPPGPSSEPLLFLPSPSRNDPFRNPLPDHYNLDPELEPPMPAQEMSCQKLIQVQLRDGSFFQIHKNSPLPVGSRVVENSDKELPNTAGSDGEDEGEGEGEGSGEEETENGDPEDSRDDEMAMDAPYAEGITDFFSFERNNSSAC